MTNAVRAIEVVREALQAPLGEQAEVALYTLGDNNPDPLGPAIGERLQQGTLPQIELDMAHQIASDINQRFGTRNRPLIHISATLGATVWRLGEAARAPLTLLRFGKAYGRTSEKGLLNGIEVGGDEVVQEFGAQALVTAGLLRWSRGHDWARQRDPALYLSPTEVAETITAFPQLSLPKVRKALTILRTHKAAALEVLDIVANSELGVEAATIHLKKRRAAERRV